MSKFIWIPAFRLNSILARGQLCFATFCCAVFCCAILCTVQAQAGPKISRWVGLAPEPHFEDIDHPDAAPGQKIIAVEIPSTNSMTNETREIQITIAFSISREIDSCNETKIYGHIAELEVPQAPYLNYFELKIKPAGISKTLKACRDTSRMVRKIDILTDLLPLRTFRDTQVFYVPENVDVTAVVWSPVQSINGTRIISP